MTITVGDARLLLSTTFAVRDLDEVRISSIPDIALDFEVRLIFDPSYKEGENSPKMGWKPAEGNSVLMTANGWAETTGWTTSKGRLATFTYEDKSQKSLSFALLHRRVSDLNHVHFQLYLRAVLS